MADNSDIRGMIRDLALKRDSIDRRQLYFALIKAEVWAPVSAKSATGHVSPGDRAARPAAVEHDDVGDAAWHGRDGRDGGLALARPRCVVRRDALHGRGVARSDEALLRVHQRVRYGAGVDGPWGDQWA